MHRIASTLVALAMLASWTAVASATPCVSRGNGVAFELTDVESFGGNQFALTLKNWDIVTSSSNDCGVAVMFETNLVSTVTDVTWLETGTSNVVAGLGTGWGTSSPVAAEADDCFPTDVFTAFTWFGFLQSSGGTTSAGQADLKITVTLALGKDAGDLINAVGGNVLAGGVGFFVFIDQFNSGTAQDVGQTCTRSIDTAERNQQTKCKRTIAKEASKFVHAKTQALQKCEEGVVAEQHADPCPNPGGAVGSAGRKAADQIAKASAKLHAAIGKLCGGVDKVCGGDIRLEIGGALTGRPETCPDFETSGCTNAIDLLSCTGIAECIECVGEKAVEQAIDLSYANLEDTNPATQEELNTCQQAIGERMTKYLLTKEKALHKCWDPLYKVSGSWVCPDITAPDYLKYPLKAAQQIAKAETKLISAICAACGGADKLCDDMVNPVNPGVPVFGGSGGTGADADFTADDILGTGPFSCPAVTVPAVPDRPAMACGGTIVTLADLIRCFDCVTEFKVDCMDPNRIDQAFAPYPAECN